MPRLLGPLAIAGGLLAVSVIALVGAFVLRPGSASGAVAGTPVYISHEPLDARTIGGAQAAPVYGLLDGVPMTKEQARAHAGLPVAVMVDNHVDARPQYGLDKAEVVYEALVEYGITRFMAVYWRTDAPRIEPVRSARAQYLGAVSELDAIYAHVGAAAEEGPADAATQMRRWGVHEVDEDPDNGAIHRDPARAAPHNAMTSTEALRALALSRGWTGAPKLSLWTFKADGGAAGTPAAAADIDFDITGTNGGAFRVRWQYDPATNSYRRFQAGAPHVDAGSGAQLTAKNVILQFAEVRPSGDRSGHVLYQSEGSGRAVLLLDGRATEGTWRKDSRTGRTRYYDAAGREIAFNRGATWVEVLPMGAPLTLG